ncbi:hypothetical protein V6N13_099671 [Hibiscus sabdariffa]
MAWWQKNSSEVVSLIVQNIPTTLHQRGLRQTFGRHGDVIDSFIPRKRNRACKRFGFVWFSNIVDAERAIERLNGFYLYGFRISVAIARFRARIAYWRRVNKGKPHQNENEKVFSEVEPWSELIHLLERITWVQAEGIPLHCWNQITFKRIAKIWEMLLAMEENANQSLDGEKVTLLISTNERSNLDGVLELEVGMECYVLEKGESSSDSSSEKGRRSSPANYKNPTNDVSINAISLEITKDGEMDVHRQVGEEFISGNPTINHHKAASCNQEENPKVGDNTDESGIRKNLEIGEEGKWER